MPDQFKIEVTRDGIIKITTDPISEENHSLAEGLLNKLADLAGGQTTREVRHDHGHAHSHHHEHHHHDHGHKH